MNSIQNPAFEDHCYSLLTNKDVGTSKHSECQENSTVVQEPINEIVNKTQKRSDYLYDKCFEYQTLTFKNLTIAQCIGHDDLTLHNDKSLIQPGECFDSIANFIEYANGKAKQWFFYYHCIRGGGINRNCEFQCVFGGSRYTSQSKGLRKRAKSLKTNCPSMICLRHVPKEDRVMVLSVCHHHNHPLNFDSYQNLQHGRRLPESIKDEIKDLLLLGLSPNIARRYVTSQTSLIMSTRFFKHMRIVANREKLLGRKYSMEKIQELDAKKKMLEEMYVNETGKVATNKMQQLTNKVQTCTRGTQLREKTEGVKLTEPQETASEENKKDEESVQFHAEIDSTQDDIISTGNGGDVMEQDGCVYFVEIDDMNNDSTQECIDYEEGSVMENNKNDNSLDEYNPETYLVTLTNAATSENYAYTAEDTNFRQLLDIKNNSMVLNMSTTEVEDSGRNAKDSEMDIDNTTDDPKVDRNDRETEENRFFDGEEYYIDSYTDECIHLDNNETGHTTNGDIESQEVIENNQSNMNLPETDDLSGQSDIIAVCNERSDTSRNQLLEMEQLHTALFGKLKTSYINKYNINQFMVKPEFSNVIEFLAEKSQIKVTDILKNVCKGCAVINVTSDNGDVNYEYEKVILAKPRLSDQKQINELEKYKNEASANLTLALTFKDKITDSNEIRTTLTQEIIKLNDCITKLKMEQSTLYQTIENSKSLEENLVSGNLKLIQDRNLLENWKRNLNEDNRSLETLNQQLSNERKLLEKFNLKLNDERKLLDNAKVQLGKEYKILQLTKKKVIEDRKLLENFKQEQNNRTNFLENAKQKLRDEKKILENFKDKLREESKLLKNCKKDIIKKMKLNEHLETKMENSRVNFFNRKRTECENKRKIIRSLAKKKDKLIWDINKLKMIKEKLFVKVKANAASYDNGKLDLLKSNLQNEIQKMSTTSCSNLMESENMSEKLIPNKKSDNCLDRNNTCNKNNNQADLNTDNFEVKEENVCDEEIVSNVSNAKKAKSETNPSLIGNTNQNIKATQTNLCQSVYSFETGHTFDMNGQILSQNEKPVSKLLDILFA